jgi:hypothetical protein
MFWLFFELLKDFTMLALSYFHNLLKISLNMVVSELGDIIESFVLMRTCKILYRHLIFNRPWTIISNVTMSHASFFPHKLVSGTVPPSVSSPIITSEAFWLELNSHPAILKIAANWLSQLLGSLHQVFSALHLNDCLSFIQFVSLVEFL